MIREIIKPQQNQIILNIPENYIDKEIELLMFPIDEYKNSNKKSKSNITNSLFGALKNTDIKEEDYKQYLEKKFL